MSTQLSDADLNEIADKLNDAIDEYSIKTLRDKPRTHLGISEIGEPCSRQLYYKFRWCNFPEYDDEHSEARMLRLFKRGHREEERFINYLEGIGCKVSRFDETGKQYRISSVLGHYGGSCDGKVLTPWVSDNFLLECKTHNSKSFIDYLNKGLHKSKPKHVSQMNGYGYHMGLEYAIYFPENKNDDDIRLRVIKLDHKAGAELEKKAAEIILAKEPPQKISENPAYFECKFCEHSNQCHYNAMPLKNCRSCRMSTPVENAQWHCSRFNDVIPADFVASGCQYWTPI